MKMVQGIQIKILHRLLQKDGPFQKAVCNGQVRPCPEVENMGDGYCDVPTNIELCDYNGGDCCDKTAVFIYCTDCTVMYKSCFTSLLVILLTNL